MRYANPVATALGLACAHPLLADCPDNGPHADPLLPGQAIVRVAAYASLHDVIAILEAEVPGLQATEAEQIPGRPIYLIEWTLPPGTTDCDVGETYLEDDSPDTLVNPNPSNPDPSRPLVWGELEYRSETPEGKSGTGYVSRPAMSAANVAGQYAGPKVGLPNAQQRSTGSGVVVAVVDTGIDGSHPWLQGRLASGGYNFVDNNAITDDAGDGVDNDGDGLTDEMVGHGTFVAGLISFVAPDAKLLPVVVLNSDGTAPNFRVAQGLFYAIDRGVEVINVSLGSTYDSEAVEDAVDEAEELGIPVVASAGNLDLEEPEEFPAMKSSAFGVVALDADDIKAGFSNYNKDAFIAAPGASELLPGGDFDPQRTVYGPVAGGAYAAWEGTSVATPLVSGAFALIRAQRPDLPPTEHTTDTLANALARNAVNIYPLNPAYADDDELGAGRLDIAAATAAYLVAPPLGDIDNSGMVGLEDLLIMLNDFGQVHSSADLDGSGEVGLTDLLILLGAFGQTRG